MAKLNLDGRSENSVAQATGIALSTLRRRIADPTSLTMSELLRIAEHFDRTPDALMRDLITDSTPASVPSSTEAA